jgi:hypothetical protein
MYSISDEHPSHGLKSIKLDLYPFNKPDYPGLAPMIKEHNWSGFNVLSFDIYSPDEQSLTISVRIDDKKEYPEYQDRYNKRIVLDPGMNNIRVPINTLVTSGTGRALKLKEIQRLSIFVKNPDRKVVLYVDYIRLIR